MIRVPSIIATLATGKAIEDLRVLLASLAIFNENPPTVYIYCDSSIASDIEKLNYPGKIVSKVVLDTYTAYNRQQMESMPGVHFKNLWFDFMTEKINLLRWVFAEESNAKNDGVMFCDADICFMGPLPEIKKKGAILALSPHEICERDANKYGYYNGGYLWMLEPRLADTWWNACKNAKFYEQSALEDLAAAVKPKELYTFPTTENYGWWRLWQGERNPMEIMRSWDTNSKVGGSGIVIDGARLGSVHTHFYEKADRATALFNEFVKGLLNKMANTYSPARMILTALE